MALCFTCPSLFSLTKEIKVTNFFANIIAFSPPTQLNYRIVDDKEKQNERGGCYKKVNFQHIDWDNVVHPWIEKDCYLLQKCSNKKKIVLIHIKNTSQENKLTIIFSHGNSCDIGVIYPFLVDLSTQLKADVISYDYSGYGLSEGTPSEKELYKDIEQVMDFVIFQLRIKQESIVL
jgi:hypothetical protein